MGADLYIQSITNAAREVWQPIFEEAANKRNAASEAGDQEQVDHWQKQVEEAYDKMYGDGYFRDSYNASSILNRLGLSWWQDVDKLLDDESYMQPDNAARFREMIASAELIPVTAEWLESHYAKVDDGENSVDAWNQMYAKSRVQLLAFLDKAISMNEAIYCSI